MGKKILIACSTFPPQKNGVSHVVAAHAIGLARLGHDVTVVTGVDPARGSHVVDGVKVKEFDVRGNGMLFWGGYSGDVEGYRRYIASFQGDLIVCHCWQIWSTNLALEAFPALKCPKMLVSHGVSAKVLIGGSLKGFLRWLAWKPYLAKLPELIRKLDHIVLLSDIKDQASFYDHELMHQMGYQNHSVIPNGADRELFEKAAPTAATFRKKYALGTRSMLLYVSNYDQRKNQQMAAEAFFRAALPNSVLVFIGSELNAYAHKVRSFVRKRRAADQEVLFLERLPIEDTASAFSAADLFICSSNWELQPLVLLEAMAAGKAFVSTDVGSVREMPGGLIVSDAREMAQAIRLLLSDDWSRIKLIQLGRRAIAEKYNWDDILRQYDALILELISSRMGIAR
jgi:glycosyltransferase involved in cell wall biosynthesis